MRIPTSARTAEFTLSITGLAGSLLDVVQTREDGRFMVDVGPDQTREIRVLVTDYAELPPPSTPINFHLYDVRPASVSRRRLLPRARRRMRWSQTTMTASAR